MKRMIWVVSAMLSLALPGVSSTFDVANDFSSTLNPNGVWTYGYETVLGGTFTVFTNSGVSGGIPYWNNLPTLEGVGHNGTAGPAGWCGSCSVPAGDDIMSPGSSGNLAVFRFITPFTDFYDIETSFFGADFTGPTSTDVHILDNGISLFSDAINGYGPSSAKNYSGIVSLTAGDTIDFIAGWGADASYNFDATGLTATISDVAAPEPNTWVLVGAAPLILWVRRRRR